MENFGTYREPPSFRHDGIGDETQVKRKRSPSTPQKPEKRLRCRGGRELEKQSGRYRSRYSGRIERLLTGCLGQSGSHNWRCALEQLQWPSGLGQAERGASLGEMDTKLGTVSR